MSYPWLPLEDVLALEPYAAAQGVSAVARSSKGFVRAYERAGGKIWNMEEFWPNKREGFIKRHRAQALNAGEQGWEDGQPSRRTLALAMWAYASNPDRLRRWLDKQPRKNPSDWDTKQQRTENPHVPTDYGPLYHGTSSDETGQKILRDGYIVAQETKLSRAKMAPVRGRIYVTRDFSYALIYALRGMLMGSDRTRDLSKEGRYGWIFEVAPDQSNDVVVDEDTLGGMVSDASGRVDPTVDFYAKQIGSIKKDRYGANLYTRARYGEAADQADLGKLLIKKLPSSVMEKLLNNAQNVAVTGKVRIVRAWRIDKSQGASMAPYDSRKTWQERARTYPIEQPGVEEWPLVRTSEQAAMQNPRPIPVDREKLVAAAKSLGEQAHRTIEREGEPFEKWVDGWVLGQFPLTVSGVTGDEHRVSVWLVTRPSRGWLDGVTGDYNRTRQHIYLFVPVDKERDFQSMRQRTGSPDWGEETLMGSLLHEVTHVRDTYSRETHHAEQSIRKSKDNAAYVNLPIEVRARMQTLSDIAVRSIPQIKREYSPKRAKIPPMPAVQWVLEQIEMWQDIEPYLTPLSRKKIMQGVERSLRDAGLDTSGRGAIPNPARKKPSLEFTSDIYDAVDYYLSMDRGTEPEGTVHFLPTAKRMPVKEILKWDDYSSWGGFRKGELVGLDAQELKNELNSFRQEWADLALEWLQSGFIPPVVLVDARKGRHIADGRGRTSLAVGMDIPELDVIILKQRSSKTPGALRFEWKDWNVVRNHGRNPTRKPSVSELLPVKVVEGGKVFETGQPVTFRTIRNTQPAPNFGSKFQQDIEPAGRYLQHLDWNPGDRPADQGWEFGEVTLESPLVISFTTDGPESPTLYGPGSWKARLHKVFKAKGCALTKAIRAAGYDSVVTVWVQGGVPGGTREIVLLPEQCNDRPRKNPSVKPPTALVGHDPTGRYDKVAPVNWNAVDLPILAPWTEAAVREWMNAPQTAVIYRSIIDLDDLDEKLAEEESEDEEEAGGYDWSELQQSRRTSPPPILVMRRAKDNALVVMDGNHRVRFWKESNYEHAPAWVYDEALTKHAKRSKKKIRVLQGEESDENPTRRNPSHDAWTGVGDASSALVIVHPSALGEYSRKVGGAKARNLAKRIADKIVSWQGSVVLLENVPYLKDRDAALIAKPVLEAAEAKGAATIVHDITGDDDFDVVLPVLKRLRAQGVTRVLLGGIWASEDFETGCVSACRDVLLSGKWWTEVDFSISGMESD